MNLSKLFFAVAACVFMPACESGECDSTCDDQDQLPAVPDKVEVVVDFLLMPDKSAYTGMWVNGRSFRAGTDGSASTPLQCQRTIISDTSMLKCSLGYVATSTDVRLMVNIPMDDGDSLPACSSLDPNQCHGTVKVTFAPDGFTPPISLIQDSAFAGGVAYRVLIPTPHSI